MNRKKLIDALEAEKKFVYWLVDHPEEFDKLPDKGELVRKRRGERIPTGAIHITDKFYMINSNGKIDQRGKH